MARDLFADIDISHPISLSLSLLVVWCATSLRAPFTFVFHEPKTESLRKIVLSHEAYVLVQLHGVPPSAIYNFKRKSYWSPTTDRPKDNRAFINKTICLGSLHISAHKPRSSSSVTSSYSHESPFPRFFYPITGQSMLKYRNTSLARVVCLDSMLTSPEGLPLMYLRISFSAEFFWLLIHASEL